MLRRASADVELHSDEESEAPEGSAAVSSAAEQQSAGLQIERSSLSEADISGASSGGSQTLSPALRLQQPLWMPAARHRSLAGKL